MPYIGMFDANRLLKMKKVATAVTVEGYELRLMPRSFNMTVLPFKEEGRSIKIDIIEVSDEDHAKIIAYNEPLKIAEMVNVEADGLEVTILVGKPEIKPFTNQRILDGDFIAFVNRKKQKAQEAQMETGLEKGFVVDEPNGYKN